MKLDELLDRLKLDAIVGLDWETYYDNDYSLSKMATTEYITDERFKAHMISVQWHSDRKAEVMPPHEFKRWARDDVDWKRTGMLAHHTHFDGLIASHHFKVKPAFYLDTLSMARPLMPVHVGGSLKAVNAAFGRVAKKRAGALENVKGVRDLTRAQYNALARYAGDDIADTWFIFRKMLPYTSFEELRLIDATVRMYAQPTLIMNTGIVAKVHADEVEKKEALLKKLNLDRKALTSNEQFAELLRAAGVEPPTKVSPRTGEVALALSKQDLEFKDLLKHPNKRVRELVEARFALKTSIVETRSQRLHARSTTLTAQPVYLNYCGAKTWRWSGGDKANYQNLGRGSDLRTAIEAPPGHTLIIADLAQIEARINAWYAGQQNIIDAFRAYDDIVGWTVDERGKPKPIRSGPDVYAYTAANAVYNKPVDKIDKDERFVGKVCVLALGYQAGAGRFAETLRIGQFGPPVDITDAHASDIVRAWRQSNQYIVAGWKRAQNNAKSAFLGKQRINDGVISYEGFDGRGATYLPNGLTMRYDKLEVDEEGMSYASKYRVLRNGEVSEERQRLYGGIIVENNTQALARQVIAYQMLDIVDALPRARIAMSTHDEVVLVVPDRSVAKALKAVTEIMSAPPAWAPDLPIAVEIHASKRYDK